mgnify:CR=1 FL=1
MISIDDFAKVDIRVGKILSVEPVEGSEKLYKEIVDFGPEIGERQILSGMQKFFTPEELVGKLGVFIINLEPRMMMGLESQGMLLAVDSNGKPVLLTTMEEVTPGAKAH